MSVHSKRRNVKYLEDSGLMISTKDASRMNQKLPPKLKGKHFSNLDYLADASLVWLTPDNSKSFPSLSYNEENESSYYEQCFSTINKLGEGSFGSVFQVLCKDDSRFYAIKLSKEPFRNDRDRCGRIQEVEHHKEFSSHPNIVTLHDAWEEDRHMFMLLELCQNNFLKTEAVPEERCWEILTDMVLALDVIHDRGMGHFDIKLENILYGYDGLYKLSDFGLVYEIKNDPHKQPREGDAKYLAPELLSSSENFTTKADIFSLGISILELLGNLSLPTNGKVWRALRNNTFPLAQTQHISDEMFFLITRMMSSDCSLRPSTKDILDMPSVKAMVEKRKAFLMQVVALPRPVNHQNLPYMAMWAYFAAIVYLTYKRLMRANSPRYDTPESNQVDGVDKTNASLQRGRISDVGCANPMLEASTSFVTSTPLIMEVDKPRKEMHQKRNVVSKLRAGKAGISYMMRCFDEKGFPTPDSTLEREQESRMPLADEWMEVHVHSPVRAVPSPELVRTPLAHIVPGSSLIAGDNSNICFSSPSIAHFGASPIRLSNRLKEVVKARKLLRVKRVELAKRKLFDMPSPSEEMDLNMPTNNDENMNIFDNAASNSLTDNVSSSVVSAPASTPKVPETKKEATKRKLFEMPNSSTDFNKPTQVDENMSLFDKSASDSLTDSVSSASLFSVPAGTPKRQRMMTPRNLSTSFDEQMYKNHG